MNSQTIIYISIAAITAISLALFQYVYKSKLNPNLKYSLAALRTLTYFGILLLLINPKFESNSYFKEKPTLVVAADNSESILFIKQNEIAKQIVDSLTKNSELNERFDIRTYSFGKSLNPLDSLSFTERQTNISRVLGQLAEVYENEVAPIVLISDGNQTYGSDYSYSSKTLKQPIYPVLLGDSAAYSDLSIKQLNVNRYAFLKNKFPIEIITNYSGKETIKTELKIWSGSTVVFRKTLQFSASKGSEIVKTALLANSVGIQTYRAEIVPLENEKNKVNNVQNFGVEVIDQKSNVAIVTELLHPDLGALKKSIESNEQRSVTILKPKEYLNGDRNFQLLIVYQPNANFRAVFDIIKKENLNTFIITGKTTDHTFLNAKDVKFRTRVTNQTEDFQPSLNRNYNVFTVNDIDFNDYPPLQSEFGALEFTVPNEVIAFKMVDGIKTDQPMLSTFEFNNSKHALLSGEGIWRWRAQAFLDSGTFLNFDNFINKLIQYLSSNKRRKRINLDYKSFYNGNDDIILSAQFFNKNYEFDDTAPLVILIRNKETEVIREIPLLLNSGNYTVDLSGTESGSYDFTVKHRDEAISASGRFEVLDYNVEQQFLNPDIQRLSLIAKNSKGDYVFNNEINQLINNLLADKRYQTIQKSTKNIVPLIDWIYLLALIALSLFAEWFIRKYNGQI